MDRVPGPHLSRGNLMRLPSIRSPLVRWPAFLVLGPAPFFLFSLAMRGIAAKAALGGEEASPSVAFVWTLTS